MNNTRHDYLAYYYYGSLSARRGEAARGCARALVV
jgi:hypothetical protein